MTLFFQLGPVKANKITPPSNTDKQNSQEAQYVWKREGRSINCFILSLSRLLSRNWTVRPCPHTVAHFLQISHTKMQMSLPQVINEASEWLTDYHHRKCQLDASCFKWEDNNCESKQLCGFMDDVSTGSLSSLLPAMPWFVLGCSSVPVYFLSLILSHNWVFLVLWWQAIFRDLFPCLLRALFCLSCLLLALFVQRCHFGIMFFLSQIFLSDYLCFVHICGIHLPFRMIPELYNGPVMKRRKSVESTVLFPLDCSSCQWSWESLLGFTRPPALAYLKTHSHRGRGESTLLTQPEVSQVRCTGLKGSVS